MNIDSERHLVIGNQSFRVVWRDLVYVRSCWAITMIVEQDEKHIQREFMGSSVVQVILLSVVFLESFVYTSSNWWSNISDDEARRFKRITEIALRSYALLGSDIAAGKTFLTKRQVLAHLRSAVPDHASYRGLLGDNQNSGSAEGFYTIFGPDHKFLTRWMYDRIDPNDVSCMVRLTSGDGMIRTFQCSGSDCVQVTCLMNHMLQLYLGNHKASQKWSECGLPSLGMFLRVDTESA